MYFDDQESDRFFLEGYLKGGSLHGLVRSFGVSLRGGSCSSKLFPGLGFLCHYRSGRPRGVCWRQLIGGAWLYAEVDKAGEFTGDNIAYIYPDLTLALLGSFLTGQMVGAREVEVEGYRLVDHVLL